MHRDPVKVDSYRGVTLSSVIAKLLELLVVGRMGTLLEEAGVPHVNQSAYSVLCRCKRLLGIGGGEAECLCASTTCIRHMIQ